MSRIHSKRKGRAASKRPFITKNPDWVTLSPSEIENLIVKLAKEGMKTSLIGLKLRDQYCVPNVRLATGKSITQILQHHGIIMELPEDLSNLMKRAVSVRAHLATHKKDLSNKRGLELIESKIRRLIKYYQREGILPPNWQYTLKTAELKAE